MLSLLIGDLIILKKLKNRNRGEVRMDVRKLLSIMPKYEVCPKCGSDKLGNGYGKLIVEDSYLERGCKCGYVVRVDEEGKEIDID